MADVAGAPEAAREGASAVSEKQPPPSSPQADGQAVNGLPKDTNGEKPPAPDGQSQQPSGGNGKHDGDGDGGDKKPSGPEGGFDSTPIPRRSRGYTLKVTIHKATNLPMADIASLSSDPFVVAQLSADVPTRHKEDPPLRFRTPTVRQSTDPVWSEEWIVANVPAAGSKLKFRIYDEDPNDNDDRLGNVHVHLDGLREGWPGIHERPYEIKVRSGSKRAYGIRLLATCFNSAKHMRGDLVVSVEVLGRTPEDGQNGRLYTVGPCRWIRHYDPFLGRIAKTKEPSDEHLDVTASQQQADADKSGAQPQQQQQDRQQQQQQKEKKKAERYDFQANQIQLEGPVPPELYHRYVEFKPWVKRMFTSSGLQGMILGKALHHQHNRVYYFDKKTTWGHFPGPCEALTKQFLDLVHWDKGGRIFTYVLTLDALWRFTETGQEFGIDLLSKHTMHSDVSIYIAFSGEFFVRRLKRPHQPAPPDPVDSTSHDHPPAHPANETHPPQDVTGGPPEEEPPRDPSHYELVIDNDSGTYRPNAKLLPILREYMAKNLPGLHVQTLDCNADAEKMGKMKDEQRELKKREGDHIIYTQGSRSSSISSSDEEDLDRVQAAMATAGPPRETGRDVLSHAARDQQLRQKAKWAKVKDDYGGIVGKAASDSGDAAPAPAAPHLAAAS